MIEVTEDAIEALAQAYLAGWSDSVPWLNAQSYHFERTKFLYFLRRQYKDHFDYFIVIYPDEYEREQWMKRQVQSFLGIPPETA